MFIGAREQYREKIFENEHASLAKYWHWPISVGDIGVKRRKSAWVSRELDYH